MAEAVLHILNRLGGVWLALATTDAAVPSRSHPFASEVPLEMSRPKSTSGGLIPAQSLRIAQMEIHPK
jgi:hypothetical protein